MPAPGSWPIASHFSQILQNPKVAFRNKELKSLEIAKDALNQPKALAGAFANVYKGVFPATQQAIAVRVFTSGAVERRERYQAISEYLQSRKLDSVVGFTYEDSGIRSAGDGKFYPLVTMDWVSGETLFTWVQGRCSGNDRRALEEISDLWIDAINELSAARIAHGDLQHANIMVTDTGRLKLVDYDCMCVPKLEGRRNLEIGVDPYQHPGRDCNTQLSPNLDNFSALFILVALKALAAAPALWHQYVEQPNYDKLLFRREDLDAPNQSTLIQTLRRSPDQDVKRLCNELLELTRARIDEVPRLDQVLFSFSNVEVLLSQHDFDGAVELLARGKKKPTDAPPALQPLIRNAQDRIKCRQDLEQAVQAGDEPAMQRLYQPKLLDDYPKAKPLVVAARQAPQVIPVLQKLQAALQARARRELVAAWDAHDALLSPRKSAARYLGEVTLWRKRNRACDSVLQLLNRPVCDAAALTEAWRQLSDLGGHPEADAKRTLVDKLLARAKAWAAFQQVPATASQQDDQRRLQAWNEPLFAGWDEAERLRPQVEKGKQRLKLLKRLHDLATQPLTALGEQALITAAASILADYHYQLSPRVEQARQRVAALAQFQQRLKSPVSDLAVAEAWQRVKKLQADALVNPTEAARAALAQERHPVLAALKQIPAGYAPSEAHQFEPSLLANWRSELLKGCIDADPWRGPHAVAVNRKALLDQLGAAIGAGDKMRIADLAADPLLDQYTLPPNWLAPVKQSAAAVQATRALLVALQSDQRSRFLDLFDAQAIRMGKDLFAPHRERIRDWLATEILPAEKLGLTPPLAQKALLFEPGSANAYRLRWRWPAPRFSDQCQVIVSPKKIDGSDDPNKLSVQLRLPIDRHSYEEGGGSRLLRAQPQWLGSYVMVWASIDLGFEVFASQPLVLGRLEPAAAQSKIRK